MNTVRIRKIMPVAVMAVVFATASCEPASRVVDRVRGTAGGKGASAQTEPAEAGRIVYLEGDVTVSGEAAEIGDAVLDGEVVTTGRDSLLELEFGEYRILRAGENARLVIDLGMETMRLDSGSLAVVQSKARWFSKEKPWLLKTPTVVAAVRGTFYFTKVEDPDSTYFCLCNGRIHLEDEAHYLDLEAAHHNAVRVKRTADGVVYQEAPMEYHDDEGMESLANLVHVPIDWSRVPE